MITFKELLGEHNISDIDLDTQLHLEDLYKKINIIRNLYDKPMVVTSGYRTLHDQLRINPKATRSKHMYGQAVDILDKNGELKAWIMKNIAVMEVVGFWFEDFAYTVSWCHFQTLPPKSGKRFFIP